MKAKLLLGSTTAAFVWTISSCAPNKPRQDEPTQAAIQVPTQHWIYDENVRAAMRLIERTALAADSMTVSDSERPAPGALRHQFEAAAKVADRLAASASALPNTIQGINLGLADRQAFIEQADVLRTKAMQLGQAARTHSIDEMRRTLDAITTTCISCHTRFRDFTGELAPPRV